MPYFIEEKLRILRLDNESQFGVSHRHINVYLNLSVICLFYASSGVNNLCVCVSTRIYFECLELTIENLYSLTVLILFITVMVFTEDENSPPSFEKRLRRGYTIIFF